MKTLNRIFFLSLITTVTSLFTTGCQDKLLDADYDGSDGLENSGDMVYMAVRIYNAAAIDAGTRAEGDSPVDEGLDNNGPSDGENDNKVFNNGIEDENRIYSSSSPTDCPNYLLVFGHKDAANKDKLEYLMPLFDWDFENNGESKDVGSTANPTTGGYDAYYTFYTSARKVEIPEKIGERKLLMVVNASEALQKDLKAALQSNKAYEDVLKMEIQRDLTKKDNDTDYIYYTDSKGEKYLTMTSSIVLPKVDMSLPTGAKEMTEIGDIGPAGIIRAYKWQPTKKDAADNPIFSFFLERVQAKYTLSFVIKGHTNKSYFFTPKSTTDAQAVGSAEYEPVTSLVIPSEDLTLAKEWQTIKYVSEYQRREPGTESDPDHVKQYIKTADKGFKINFTGWGINGVEKRENLFKQIEKNKEYYRTWNPDVYSPYRNFWAEDPNYSETDYPDQFREAKYIENGKDENNKESSAIKWAQIKKNDDIKFWEDKYDYFNDNKYLKYFNANSMRNWTPHLYSPENTINYEVFGTTDEARLKSNEGRAYMRACSHIILTAQLLIDGMEPAGLFENPFFNTNHMAQTASGATVVSKYYMNGIFWSPAAYREYVGEYLGYWMQEDEETFGKDNDGIFYLTNETLVSGQNIAAQDEHFKVEPLKMEGSDSWAHLIPDLDEVLKELPYKIPEDLRQKYIDSGNSVKNFTEEEKQNLIVFYTRNSKYVGKEEETENADSDSEVEFYPITLRQFEILALSHPEYFARHFNLGRMYYAIPVTHYLPTNEDRTIYAGKYGAVRNHWYNFTINSISQLGTPIDDPDQELIIPNTDHSYESLGVTLSVLPWHIVTEEIDITGQRQPARPDQIDIDLYMKVDDWDYSGKEYDY